MAAEKADSLAEFCQKIQWLSEVDYGDFKRKANLYIARLAESLPSASPDVVRRLSALRDFVVFNPTWDIELTRARLIREANELKSMI